jgi:hypothetical protein
MWLRLGLFERKVRPAQADPAGIFECFNIKQSRGRLLGAAKSAAGKTRFIHCVDATSQLPRIILCIPGANRQLGFLLSADAGQVTTEGEIDSGLAISVRMERGAADSPVSLLHPINPSWRLGVLTENGRADGALAFTHREPHPDCEFSLEHIETSSLALPVRRAAQEIAKIISVTYGWEEVMSAARRGSLRHALVGAILRCLPVDELEALAIRLAEDAPLRGLVRSCLQDDRWMSGRLDRLLAWKANRDQHAFCSGEVTFAEADDIPGSKKPTAHRPGLGLALVALVRRNTRARRMACVVGSARNEGPYLLDWIAHHRAIGFEHIFLYTNDNTDGSDEILGLLARAGVITWLDNQLGEYSLPQFRAYAHALSILPQTLDYRWTLVADLDEYFAYDTGRFDSVADYLAWQETRCAEAVALPWLIYVAGRNDVWRDASCMERFPMREASVNHHVKSIFRTNLHWSSSCHNPLPMMELPINYRAQNRLPHVAKSPENNMALAHNPQATHAWIAHYIFKSAPEAMMKLARGKGDTGLSERHVDMARVMKPYITLCNKTDLVQDWRTARCAHGMMMERARLRAIKGVYECERSIKERFHSEMTEACMRFIRQGRVTGENEACATFRSMLQKQSHDALFSHAN